MRVIEPHQLKNRQNYRSHSKAWRTITYSLLILLLITIGLGAWVYNSPLPNVTANTVTFNIKSKPVSLPWPSYGQASIGMVGAGTLASTSNQKPVPTASVAKVLTALAVLKIKPLTDSSQGPTIILSDSDVQLYNYYAVKNGSKVIVKSGEQISERQALEAMLLPSANNVADSLAIWAFGSIQKYSDYANNLAHQLGMSSTTITSASGYDPSTVSTANDLVKLGTVALNNPTISAIVVEKNAVLPVAGKVSNVNFLLGKSEIVGIKTGNTDQAGGCYLFATNHQWPNGKNNYFVGAIMKAPDLPSALNDSLPILTATYNNFETRTLLRKGDVVAYYNLPWGGQVEAIAASDLNVSAWKGSDSNADVIANNIEVGTKAGTNVGKVESGKKSIDMVLKTDVSSPSTTWRLYQRFL